MSATVRPRHPAWRTAATLVAGTLLTVAACTALAVGIAAGEQALRGSGLVRSPWLLVLLPIAFVAIAWITRTLLPGAQGGGIPQTIVALGALPGTAQQALLSLRIAVGKTLLTILALGAGASLGREGPAVQIGASFFHALSGNRRPGAQQAREFVLLGAAAGVAATFITPLAGVVFVIEQLRGRLRLPSLLMTTLVAFAAAALSQRFAHGIGALPIIDAASLPTISWSAIMACGIGGGLLGGLFARVLLAMLRVLAMPLRHQPLRVAAACGFVVALIALASDGAAAGPGLGELQRWLASGEGPAPGFTLAKWLATLVSAISGLSGGLLSPSLAIGAGMGAELAPWLGAVALAGPVLLGMAAYQAGATRTPLTAALLVIEGLQVYSLALPILASALLASCTSRLICRQPLFDGLAELIRQRSDAESSAATRSSLAGASPLTAPGAARSPPRSARCGPDPRP